MMMMIMKMVVVAAVVTLVVPVLVLLLRGRVGVLFPPSPSLSSSSSSYDPTTGAVYNPKRCYVTSTWPPLTLTLPPTSKPSALSP